MSEISTAAADVLAVAVEGVTLTSDERHFFATVRPAGLTIFRRNLPTPQENLRELVHELQSLTSSRQLPLFVAIDQEGGRVARLQTPFPNPGPAFSLARSEVTPDALAEIKAHGELCGQELLRLGVNVNFAPVLDVLSEPTNTAIGDRAFSDSAAKVLARAGAFFSGMQGSGVLGCLKHFPGQGAAKVDTHLGCAVIDAPLSLLQNRDIMPFKEPIPHASMVMISHSIYSALDASTPASFSSRIMNGLLRDELRFDGVVVSDDLNMGALPQERAAWLQNIIAAITAGSDLLLICRHLDRMQAAWETLIHEAERSSAFATRLFEAASRVNRLRQNLVVS